MGQDTAGAAARAFRLLNSPALRQPTRNAPAERRTTSTTPAAPLDLGLLDYLNAHVDEVITHTRAAAGEPGPVPRQRADIYDWCEQVIPTTEEDQQLLLRTMLERHRLEHAVRLGDFNAIRKEFCPACGCLGLFWEDAAQRAACSNRRCRTPDGLTQRWTLARLAAQKAGGTEKWRRNAT
ncbi:hypothetical protein OV320_2604 [Actinobacteria bacterium OV320]|jgi:hypothetical protein|nr:hypothetical protein OV320_2604 [Actinobacteria bacterium OV320]